MDKIKEIEKLYAEWTSKAAKSIKNKFVGQATMEANVVCGIHLALNIIKKNNEHCPLCAEMIGYKEENRNFCINCGRSLK